MAMIKLLKLNSFKMKAFTDTLWFLVYYTSTFKLFHMQNAIYIEIPLHFTAYFGDNIKAMNFSK